MPFVARCVRCNWITWAITRGILNICMEEHDIKSHKDLATYNFKDYCTWTIVTVSHEILSALDRASKNPAFWKAIRSSPKRIIPLFSGLVAGRLSLSANRTEVANGGATCSQPNG